MRVGGKNLSQYLAKTRDMPEPEILIQMAVLTLNSQSGGSSSFTSVPLTDKSQDRGLESLNADLRLGPAFVANCDTL